MTPVTATIIFLPTDEWQKTESGFILFASRFDRRDRNKIGWQVVGRKCFDIHFDQAHEGATEIRFGLAASVDNHAHGGNNPAVRAHDVDRFLDASASGYDILGDNESFAIVDLESAPQSQFAGFFLGKDMAFA